MRAPAHHISQILYKQSLILERSWHTGREKTAGGGRREAPVAGKPEDQTASALVAWGGLRASDADRDRVVDVLHAALAQGRLTRDEFTARMGRALQSRTWAELAAVTAGLGTSGLGTSGLGASGLGAPVPARVRTPVSRKKVAVRAAGVLVVAASVAAFFTFYGGFIVLLVLAFIATIATGSGPGSGR